MVVERDPPVQPDDEADLVVILQVPADPRQVRDDVDSVRAEQVGRSDAGKLEELRRLQRARAEDDAGRVRGACARPVAPRHADGATAAR